jgi:hypothetical protein
VTGDTPEDPTAFRTGQLLSVTTTSASTMAALALAPARALFPSLGQSLLGKTLTLSAAIPTFLAAPRASTWTIPSLVDALAELFPSILMAVPKKKVSHSRKSMRSANKGLKDKHSESYWLPSRRYLPAMPDLRVKTWFIVPLVVLRSWRTICVHIATPR